jgi:hypothetical protein
METQGLQPEIKFSIEIRKTTSEQREAGKRLFLKLINRAQNTAKAWAQAGAEAPPAVKIQTRQGLGNPPSLTNRGDSTYRC